MHISAFEQINVWWMFLSLHLFPFPLSAFLFFFFGENSLFSNPLSATPWSPLRLFHLLSDLDKVSTHENQMIPW